MYTALHTPDPAVRRLAAARPLLVDVVPARELVPHLAAGGVSHAGPPIASTDMCAPMRRAVGVALAIEGVAATPEEALELVDAGRIPLRTNHDLGGVGPMSGVVTGSMPLLVARDEATGTVAWCPLNEGSGAVLRYGADGEEVVRRLEWMRDELGPALAAALRAHGPLDLVDLQERALLLGDECHHRTDAGTALVADLLGPHLPEDARAFVAGNSQFFLNLAMVAAKLATVCAEGVPGSALVTAIARNGVEVGIRLSGTGDAWFVGPAALPDPARLEPGHGPADMNPDLGDSAIVEVYGLGALAIASSPLSAPSVGLDPGEIDAIDARLRGIAAADHPLLQLRRTDGTSAPAILGVDARAVVELGIRPPVHTGIAHRRPGVGQIGGGVTHPPENAFHAAVAALDGASVPAAT
ncbi:DUF1116 domain-containing protein [Patulibacter minatonensis]|uniref:DUF1116 domain-containing protein n=1 Tax=Patulibacter minatonensis TaxID=298163 RepID=UPI00047A537E|nr:DUF1116 domain-containing protein [Patulibacter minatonensis]